MSTINERYQAVMVFQFFSNQTPFYLHAGFALGILLSLNACTGQIFAPVGWTTQTKQTAQNNENQWHTVEIGENLYQIAQRYQQDYKTLATWNRLSPPYTLYPNQRLRISPATNIKTTRNTTLRQVNRNQSTPTNKQTALCQANNHGLSAWQWPTQALSYQKTFSRTGRQGLDLFGYNGQAIYAAHAGQVIYSGAGVNGYQGGLIIIRHNDAYLTIYAQNQRRWVAEGTQVQRGQRIADMGLNAQRQAALHFEISCYRKTVAPLAYFFQGQIDGR